MMHRKVHPQHLLYCVGMFYHSLGQNFLFVDLWEFFSDLGSGEQNKKKPVDWSFSEFFSQSFFFISPEKTVKIVR